VVNQTIARVWSTGSLLLDPGRLIDCLLDQLEVLSLAMVPVQADMRTCREIRVKTRFD
jgi:hypothetical protein